MYQRLQRIQHAIRIAAASEEGEFAEDMVGFAVGCAALHQARSTDVVSKAYRVPSSHPQLSDTRARIVLNLEILHECLPSSIFRTHFPALWRSLIYEPQRSIRPLALKIR